MELHLLTLQCVFKVNHYATVAASFVSDMDCISAVRMWMS